MCKLNMFSLFFFCYFYKFKINITFDKDGHGHGHVSSKQPLEQSLKLFFQEFPPYYDSLDICGQFDGRTVEINTCESFGEPLIHEEIIVLLYEVGYNELEWSLNL